MKASHTRGAIRISFDHPGLVSDAGLVPLMRLAHDAGLGWLADKHIRLGGSVGSNAGAKIGSIVAGMATGASTIDGLARIGHGGMPRLFTGTRAPSTLGSFLRWFSIGHVRQAQLVSRLILLNLVAGTPLLLPGVDQVAYVDIDAKIKQVRGTQKEGARYGYTHVRGLNYLLATLSTPLAAPVILASRLRGGNANSARGASSLLREALAAARACGAHGMLIVRADSAFFTGEIIATIRAAGAFFSITTPQHGNVREVISQIPEQHWRPVTYDSPIHDNDTQAWITSGEIAQTGLTAFTNATHNPGRRVTARLIVRRHHIANDRDEQGELFPIYRYHAVFTDSHLDPIAAETTHRGRAGCIEPLFAELNAAALAHFPSGRFAANATWLTLACLTHNLLRTLGCLAGRHFAKARTTTLRERLIHLAAVVVHAARGIRLRLPHNWPWQHAFTQLFTHAHAPPPTPQH